MPAWKVPDDRIAFELRSRLGEDTSVYIDSTSAALAGSDAVILAPTAYKGITMLITARRRESAPAYASAAVLDELRQNIAEASTTPAPSEFSVPEETASFDAPAFVEDQPPVTEPTSPTTDPAFTEPSAPVYEQPSPAESVESSSRPEVENESEEEFFGPTTWERIENAEVELGPVVRSEFSAPSEQKEITAPAPDLTGIPSLPEPVTAETYANSNPEAILPPTSKATPERRYIATGFLGLDETVEDDEDLARDKRPWWKRLFID